MIRSGLWVPKGVPNIEKRPRLQPDSIKPVTYFVKADETGVTFWPTYPGIIAVDGSAAIRFEGLDLSPYAGLKGYRTPYKIVLADSSGVEYEGYLAEADAALALGAELVANGDCEAAIASFEAEDGAYNATAALSAAQKHGGLKSALITSTVDGTMGYMLKDGDLSTATTLKMYKLAGWAYLPSGQSITALQVVGHGSGAVTLIKSITATDTWTEAVGYITAVTELRLYFKALGAAIGDVFYFDDISIKEVTALGTDGCLVVNTQGGPVQNWIKGPGFNLNDGSGYTLEIRTA